MEKLPAKGQDGALNKWVLVRSCPNAIPFSPVVNASASSQPGQRKPLTSLETIDQLAVDPISHPLGLKQAQTGKYRLAPYQAAAIRRAPPFVMTVMEAAAYLAISPRKLRELIAARRVRFARVGAKILLRREYLDELVSAP